MAKVFIGVDPHRLSATIEVVDRHERVLATGRFATDKAGYAAMRRHVAGYRDRVWAVEGSNGTGRPLAQRLLSFGEHVVDVPAKLSARAAAGHRAQPQDRRPRRARRHRGRGAHQDVAGAVPRCRRRVLRMLVDRRDGRTGAKGHAVNRRQRLLSELVPGQAKKDLTALQAKTTLAGVRPRDVAGKTCGRLALEQLSTGGRSGGRWALRSRLQ